MRSLFLFCFVFWSLLAHGQTTSIDDLCTAQEWNTVYFPYRWGWDMASQTRIDDFYTFQKFKEAIEEIGNIELLFERRCGTNQLKVTRIDTTTGIEKVLSVSTDYDASWNISKPVVKEKVVYKNFLNEGDITTRKRELAAFFSNISHETTGGPATNNNYKWGLYFLEEGENLSSPPNTYVSASTEYPAVSGQSYHGRGPIQLSYNYNYGPASEQILGDKNILLNNPGAVSSDAKLAFMTAIWFWMTPQAPKPSSHDVMVGNWTPTTAEVADNRVPGLGMTVNIINGGVECGDGGAEKYQVVDRINYYKRYINYLGISTDLDGTNMCDTCGCAAMSNYANDNISSEDCTNIPSIEITAPIDGSLIFDSSLSAISINSQYNAVGKQAEQFKIDVDQESFAQTSFSWTPRFFKAYLFKASILIDGIMYDAQSAVTLYEDNSTIDCSAIEEFSSALPYQTDEIIQFNGKIYKANYWINQDPQADSAAWTEIGTCMAGNNPPSLTLTDNSTDVMFSIDAASTDNDGGIFFVDFYVDNSLVESYNPRSTTVQQLPSSMYTFKYAPSQNKQYQIKIIAYDRYGSATEKTLQITAQTLSNSEHVIDALSVYPNPFHDRVQIIAPVRFGETQIEVFDLLGRRVKHTSFDFSNKKRLMLTLPKASQALYFMRFTTDSHKEIIQLIQK